MAATLLSDLRPRRHAFVAPPGVLAAARRKSSVRLGSVFAVVLLQILLYLQTLINSPVLPGNWAPLQPVFLVDVIYSSVALAMLALIEVVNPVKAKLLVLQPGGFPGFVFAGAVFAFVGTLGWVAFFSLGSSAHASGPVTDTQRLQGIVQYILFVAVSETLLFQVAISEFFANPILGGAVSSFAFGGYHIFAYSAGIGGFAGWALLFHLVVAGVFGFGFWAVYRLWGIAPAMMLHGTYDLAASGIIGLGHLAIVGPFTFVPF